MDEIIVRVMRAVACRSRLRILRLLATRGELTPTTLSREIGISLPAISLHLRQLVSVGLILRRPSGLCCFCVPKSPYSRTTLSGKVASWLRRLLRVPEEGEAARIQCATKGIKHDASPAVDECIFEAATAFANLRRLRILDYLRGKGPTNFETLGTKLKISPAALNRHVDKLVRRGYVELCDDRGRNTCRLAARGKTRIHADLLRMVSDFGAAAT